MRKFIVLSLVFVIILSLAACSKETNSGSNNQSSNASGNSSGVKEDTSKKVTIKYALPTAFVSGTEGLDPINKLFDLYVSKHPGITVEIVPIPFNGWSDYLTKLQTMIASGNAPDVFYNPAEGEMIARKLGIVQPLNTFLDKNPEIWDDYTKNVPREFAKATMDEKTVYGLVQLWENYVIWLNLDRLKEAGLDVPDVNWTWDEFEKYCKALSKPGEGKYAINVPNFYYAFNQWLYSFGTGYFNDDYTKIDFGSDKSVELMQFWQDAVKKGYSPIPEPNTDSLEQFVTGKIAMAGAGRWLTATAVRNDFKNVAVVRVPKKYSDRQQFAFASSQVLKSTKHYDEAASVAAFTASKEFVEKWNTVSGEIPSRTDVMSPEQLPFKFKNQELFLNVNENAVSMQNPPSFIEVSNIFDRTLSAVLSGDVNVPDIMKSAANEMEKELKRN